MRTLIALLVVLLPFGGGKVYCQDDAPDAALTFSRSVNIPLNAVQLYDKALDAWTWTFGREPGAMLKRSDRDQGVLEGVARVNFRSEMLTNREETMGVVHYRVVVQVRAGECRVVVSELTHVGNRAAPRGGIHVGPLTKGIDPPTRVSGMGRSNVQRLYADMKEVATKQITSVMQAFEARLRASVEP